MKNRFLTFTFAVVIALLAPQPGFCRDRVFLKSGDLFVGKLLKNDHEEVAIALEQGGTITFDRQAVKEVREDPDTVAERRRLKSLLTTSLPITIAQKPEHDARPFSVNKKKPVRRAVRGLRTELLEPAFEDEESGFSVHPPKGVQQDIGVRQPGMVAAFQDSVTRTNLTVFRSTVNTTLRKLRQQVKDRFSSREIIRDKPLGNADLEGWLLEMRSRVGGVRVRQTQVYIKESSNVYVLTYTTLEKHHKMYREAFNESIRSIVVRRK